jgi:hypothetical protein
MARRLRARSACSSAERAFICLDTLEALWSCVIVIVSVYVMGLCV